MNVVTAILLTSALAAGDPGPPEGAKSPPRDGAAAKATSPAAAQSKTQPKKSGTTGSLDDDLFGDLTGELFDGLEKPKLGKQPVTGKEPAKTGADAKKQPPEKAAPNKPKQGAGKQDLPPEEFGPGEDLGQESNPLLDLGQRMRRAQSLISEGSTGDPTQRLQGDIVKDLDKLIKIASRT